MSPTARSPALDGALAEAKRRLRALFGDRLLELRLFGSVARGEAGQGSDVDLLVVVDRIATFHDRIVAMDAVIGAGMERDFLFEPMVLGVEELDLLRRRETALARALDGDGVAPVTGESRSANAAAEVAKSRASLAAADQLIAIGLFDDAVSRLYYAVFHLASAATLALGVEATSHRGLLSLFAQHLVQPGLISAEGGRILAALFGLRNQADYNRYFVVDGAGAREERARAQKLIDELDAYLRTSGVLGG